MRPSSMTAIAEGPAAPLSPRTRADLRADRPPRPAPFVRSESGRRLARALDRFARGDRDREALLIHGPPGSGRTTVVLRAVEQAMVALTWLHRPVQLLPVPIRTGALWAGNGDRFDEVRAVARHLAVATLTELVERMLARAGDDADRVSAVEAIWQLLRGVPDPDELKSMRHKAEPRFSLFDEEDDEEDEGVSREADVLWQAVRLRGVRKPAPPTPIVEQVAGPTIDPAVVEALRDEVEALASALAERDEVIAEQIRMASRSKDPSAVVLGAIGGAALGLALGMDSIGFASGFVGTVLGGGLGFLLARKAEHEIDIDLADPPAVSQAPLMAEAPDAPEPVAEDDDEAPAVDDGPQDVDALTDLIAHFIHDLRSVGYAPVFILDELDRAHAERAPVEARIGRLLADLPDGACAILVADDETFGAGVPEITDRLPVSYSPPALHAYLDRRLTLPGDLSETAEADARVDKAILRYALMHAARMRPDGLDRMLTDRRMGNVRLDAQAPRSVYGMRIRAAQQMALELVLAERGGQRSGERAFTRLLTSALQLPLIRWADNQPPDITVEELKAHLDRSLPGAWARADTAWHDRIWAALSQLLGLLSSRAGLVARLPSHLAPFADLIPDAPLVVRHGEAFRWAFDADGRPTEAGLAEDDGQAGDSPDEVGARFRALAGQTLEPARRLIPGDPLPLTGEYRAFTAARPTNRDSFDRDGSLDGSLDGSADENRGAFGTRRPFIGAAEAARFLEAVDEALAEVGDGSLSIGRLARVGLVPTIPTPSAVARALTEGDTPHARIVLDEAVGRIRERLGVIEKFALWLTAARTLVPDAEIGTLEIAATLVRARALRGRSAAAQHAHLVNRILQSELRSLCPRLRLKTSIFRRQATPGTDPEALARWGEVLKRKAEDLTDALVATGMTDKSLNSVSWRALRTRLRLLVTDGEAGLPTFAETIAALLGVAGATVTDWLSPAPTARNLSALLLAAREHSESDKLGDGGLYAALALGLNRNGTDAVGLELPTKETSEAGDLIRETSRARAPVVLILTTDPRRGLAASRPPRRGSALVLTPDEVITSTKKLGFEVIFLDDPTIDAGMLPLPPAPVLAPPVTDDIDAALGWWTTHR